MKPIQIIFVILITAVLAFIAASHEEPTQICTWQKCGLSKGDLINCDAVLEHGTQNDLTSVIQRTNKGAVTWSCE